jgi:hypothetical protein
MRKVKIYRCDGDDLDEDALAALLAAADCEAVEDGAAEAEETADETTAADADDTEREGDNDVDGDDEPVPLIVVLGPCLDKDDGLEPALIKAVADDRQVICIWPIDAAGAAAPAAVGKYSADQIAWDPAKLKSALRREVAPHYDAPGGAPRAAPETPRHKC